MNSFIDIARIKIKAGKGGDGAVAFHREKYVAAGGPDGGDGGRGGNIVFVADDNMSTLMDFKYKRKYIAGDGMPGAGKRCNGKDGETLYLHVPRGTVIRDTATNSIMHDMSSEDSWVAAKGGRGGWGNMHFATPTRQVPRFAKPGLPGEEFDITLELKMIADVGLIGFPNVGKSTLLSVVSKATPKIGAYHFTTIHPNLGVVYVDESRSFVMADIPGLIEGASQGIGLGHDFLRHIDRCRLLVHVIDVSGSEGRDPVNDFAIINRELAQYSETLSTRPQIVVANKCDLVSTDRNNVESLRKAAEEKQYKFFVISAATHIGIKELINECAHELSSLPASISFESDYIPTKPELGTADDIEINHFDDLWTLEGPWLQRLCSKVNFSDYESKMFFDRVLRDSGIYSRMEKMGVKNGDTVSIYDLLFEYQD